jgi:Protein kinase domain
MQRDLALISYKKINHKSSSSNSDMSLPFTFPSDSNNFLKPKSKNCLNLSADRRPPEINTHIVSPRNQPNFIITPKDFCEKAPIDVRPHTTKYSQKHFDLENKAKKDWEDIKVPINPSAVVKMFSNKLTDFEKVEIVKYTNIYFIGNGSKPNLKEFDDESGDYVVYIHDHIHYRYEIISVLGKGSFGQVIEVYDHATTKTLAMKIIKNHRDFYEQAQVEISMLKSLKENDRDASSNIVHYEENFVFRNHIVRLT